MYWSYSHRSDWILSQRGYNHNVLVCNFDCHLVVLLIEKQVLKSLKLKKDQKKQFMISQIIKKWKIKINKIQNHQTYVDRIRITIKRVKFKRLICKCNNYFQGLTHCNKSLMFNDPPTVIQEGLQQIPYFPTTLKMRLT